MKILLYIISFLLIIIWIILFKPISFLHLLLVLAGLIIAVTIVFDDKLSKNRKNNH